MKVRPCWPYDKKITYRVNWGDGSPPDEMEFDPVAYARFNHTWIAPGSPTITATTVKDKHGIPHPLRSCHTALVGGYVIEGHVPADVVKKLLRERPTPTRYSASASS